MNGCLNQSSLIQARDWLNKIKIPYIVMPGNHDLGANTWKSEESPTLEYYESTHLEKTNYGSVFKHPNVVSEYRGGVVFISLVLRENDPDNTLETLEGLLKNINQPIILCGHYPVIETRKTG